MPLLTPSRIAVVVLSLSLLTFLWTWGLPHPLPQPSFPHINHGHDAPQKPAHEVLNDKPSNNLEVPDFPFAPEQNQEQTAKTSSIESPTHGPVPTSQSSPTATGSKEPEPTAKEENIYQGGEKGSSSEASVQTTGASVPLPTGNNATIAAEPAANPTSSSSTSQTPTPTPVMKFCKDVHHAPNVMVVVKTSKGEIAEKLPTHLKTLLSCVPNFAIFSDHAGEIDGFTVHDALDSISDSTKSLHGEFKDYERMRAGETIEPGSVNKDLDKWKFLPMVYRAYKMRPYSRFYVFIEADTSLSWTNLLQWVDRLDYRIPYYSGAPSYAENVRFAQRGPGILLSHGALRQYAKAYEERYTSEWESRVGKACCGDTVLATTMTASHVEFYSGWPLLQGETPTTLDWTERHWCAPMVSWHHMNKLDLENVWNHQRNWTGKYGWEIPYLFEHAFRQLIEPNLVELKDDWDNISEDTKIAKPAAAEPDSQENVEWNKHGEALRKSVESPENCRHVCELAEDCLQWKFTNHNEGECSLGKVVRFGKKVERKDGDPRRSSGWMLERIKTVTAGWECKEAKWKFNQ